MPLLQHPNWLRLALFLIPFSLPFSKNATTMPMVILLLVWLFHQPFQKRLDAIRQNLFPLIFIVSIWLVALIGMAWSAYPDLGMLDLKLKLPLLLLPLVFFSLTIEEKAELKYAFGGMVVGIVIAGLICIGSAAWDYLQYGERHFFYKDLTEVLWMHPGYLSMYALFTIFGLGIYYYRKRKEWGKRKKVLMIAVMLFLFGFTMLLAGRMQIITGFLLANLFLIGFLLRKRRFKVLLVLLVINSISLFTLSQLDFVKMRFYYLRNPEFSYQQEGKWNGTQMRLAIWTVSWEIISEHPLTGVGTGASQPALQESYNDKSFELAYTQSYNTHNQYLQQWLSNGLPGILVFVLFLSYFSYRSWTNRNWLLLFLMLQLLFSSLTESILQTQSGVVYLAFWVPALWAGIREVTSSTGHQ